MAKASLIPVLSLIKNYKFQRGCKYGVSNITNKDSARQHSVERLGVARAGKPIPYEAVRARPPVPAGPAAHNPQLFHSGAQQCRPRNPDPRRGAQSPFPERSSTSAASPAVGGRHPDPVPSHHLHEELADKTALAAPHTHICIKLALLVAVRHGGCHARRPKDCDFCRRRRRLKTRPLARRAARTDQGLATADDRQPGERHPRKGLL